MSAPLGVVLAGGGSTRFGSPKGLARVAGERLMDRVARALRDAVPQIILVANHEDAPAWLPGVRCIRDVRPGGGGLSGVHAALTYAALTHAALTNAGRPVIVAAWDMPFVTGALLRELARRCTEHEAQACVPESTSPTGMEPFCACYAPACLPALEAALDAGTVGAARFVRSLDRVEWLSAPQSREFGDPDRIFCSVNTPADLARAEAMAAPTL